MRDIKLRGLRTDGKGWVYGILLKNKVGVFIVTEENPHYCHQYGYIEIDQFQPVIPESVGQYIETINNQEVFDGDIFCIKHSQYSYYVKIENGLQAICYHVDKKDWDDKSPLRWGPLYRIKELGWQNDFHITGNIHQNK
jgi:hypothetical protein